MSGSVVVKYKYDAWGNIVYQFGGTLADINPYRYRGYRFDVETGYYYLQSRYYNPQIGRFISADGQVNDGILGENMYAYAENNPIMNVDPLGNDGTLLFKDLIPAVVFIVAVLAILYFAYEILDTIVTIVEEYNRNAPKEYTVYTLIDDSGTVKYVGRVKTVNYRTRMNQHFNAKGLRPGMKIDHLNYWECRGLEQILMGSVATSVFDIKTNPNGNKN